MPRTPQLPCKCIGGIAATSCAAAEQSNARKATSMLAALSCRQRSAGSAAHGELVTRQVSRAVRGDLSRRNSAAGSRRGLAECREPCRMVNALATGKPRPVLNQIACRGRMQRCLAAVNRIWACCHVQVWPRDLRMYLQGSPACQMLTHLKGL